MPKFTTTSPLPRDIDRAAALALLHDHVTMIDLNPLVTSRERMDTPPRGQTNDPDQEWYAVTDRIDYLPRGWPGGLTTGSVAYTCGFRDVPDGMETHCLAAMGVETRSRWVVVDGSSGSGEGGVEGGSGGGEGAGLCLREEVDLRCNVLLAAFVRSTIIRSHDDLVGRFVARVRERQGRQEAE